MRTAKAWVSAVGMVVTALTAALSDDIFDVSDTTQVVSTVIVASAAVYGVYKTRNAYAATDSSRLPQ